MAQEEYFIVTEGRSNVTARVVYAGKGTAEETIAKLAEQGLLVTRDPHSEPNALTPYELDNNGRHYSITRITVSDEGESKRILIWKSQSFGEGHGVELNLDEKVIALFKDIIGV